MKTLSNFHIIQHPLMESKISTLRDKSTPAKLFRELTTQISIMLTYEMSNNLPLSEVHIETPLASITGSILAENNCVVVPILRAGLGMVAGVLQLIPNARVRHIGLERDDNDMQIKQYYFKTLHHPEKRIYIITDPMLATGSSAIHAAHMLSR